MLHIDCAGKVLDLSHPRVMGILNVTPDSFSDGNRWGSLEVACEQAHRMVEAGVAIIDLGGESTRPGAEPVSVQEELDRVLPVLEALSSTLTVPISIDTVKPEVMRAAVQAGAGLINDVYALRQPGALATAAELQVPVCLVHMRGEPRTMQQHPRYADVVTEVRDFLVTRLKACEAAGIDQARVIFDPGFGFGKTLVHNLNLLRRLQDLASTGQPVLVGLSRKAMIGTLTGREVHARLPGSLAAAVIAALRGALIIRAHDVAPTVEALKVAQAVQQLE